MEEEKNVEEVALEEASNENKPHPTGNPEREPQGSRGASRDNKRKGSSKGKPGERRGGRGGLRAREEDNFTDRVVEINKVTRVEKGGKHMRFTALVVVGDGQGHYGYAMKKSGEVPDAIKKSLTAAKKDLHTIKIAKGATIAHEVVGEYTSTKVVLKPASTGTGVIAGGAVRAILELAGIQNVCSKVYGSRTAINVVRATDAALKQLKEYEKVMVLRGLKSPEDFKPAPQKEEN